MNATIFDSAFNRDVFTTPAMRAVFSDVAFLARCVEFEVALARAEARCGLIPEAAAAAIADRAPGVALDLDALRKATNNVGYPVLGLVKQVAAALGEPGRYLHWGATTQDVMDTAVVLQMREGLDLIEDALAAVERDLVAVATTHRDTVMAGRTHLQQALPVTLGHKAAVWLSMVQRMRPRLASAREGALHLQFGGAAGTLASLGDRGLDVRRALARDLKLAEPVISWHVARDGFVEMVQTLALLCGALGKIGFDVMLLMASEIGEVFEPYADHRGGSSTMPQKRNPIASEILVANAKLAREQASLMLDAMVADLERASGPWHVEWSAIPKAFMLAAGSLHQAHLILSGLEVDPARMSANLALTRGLIVAEAVMMGLAPVMGREAAHDAVYAACRKAVAAGEPLLEALRKTPAIAGEVDDDTLVRLCDPAGYLGVAGAMVDAVVKRSR